MKCQFNSDHSGLDGDASPFFSSQVSGTQSNATNYRTKDTANDAFLRQHDSELWLLSEKLLLCLRLTLNTYSSASSFQGSSDSMADPVRLNMSEHANRSLTAFLPSFTI